MRGELLACHTYGMPKKLTFYLGDEEIALLRQSSESEGVSRARSLRVRFAATFAPYSEGAQYRNRPKWAW